VLQGFNGQLTMLDGARAGGGMHEGAQSDYGADAQASEPRRGAKGGSKGGFDKQLDDEIPF
jgi:single-strand DNA-binding protein